MKTLFWKMEVRKKELSSLFQKIHCWILIQQGEKLFLIFYPNKNIFNKHEEILSTSFTLKGFYRRLKKVKGERRRTSWGSRPWVSLFPKKERKGLLETPYKTGGAALGLAGAASIFAGYAAFKKTPSF